MFQYNLIPKADLSLNLFRVSVQSHPQGRPVTQPVLCFSTISSSKCSVFQYNLTKADLSLNLFRVSVQSHPQGRPVTQPVLCFSTISSPRPTCHSTCSVFQYNLIPKADLSLNLFCVSVQPHPQGRPVTQPVLCFSTISSPRPTCHSTCSVFQYNLIPKADLSLNLFRVSVQPHPQGRPVTQPVLCFSTISSPRPTCHSTCSVFQYNLIPKADLSLKVLAELPIIVVLMYQLYKQHVHNEVAEFIPLIMNTIVLQPSRQHRSV